MFSQGRSERRGFPTRRRWSFSSSRALGAIGWTALALGAARYRSFANREILDRWSPGYTALLLLLVAVAVWAWTGALRKVASEVHQVLLRWAILFGGLGYLWASEQSPKAPAQMLDLNLFGSAGAVSALLQWLSLSCLFASAAARIRDIRHDRWKQAAVVAASICTALVLAEGVARIRVALAPSTQGFPTYSQQAWLNRYAAMNREGFRDDSLSSAPPLEKRRLLVIGDSVAFGFGLERLEQRFGEQLALRLAERTAQPWESLTAAAPDTHTLDHIRFLEKCRSFQPDVIVLLYGLNDVDYLYDITRRLGPLQQRFSPVRLAFLNSYLFQEAYARFRAFEWLQERRQGSHGEPVPEELMTGHLGDLKKFVAAARASACVVGVTIHGWLALGSPEIRRRFDQFYERAAAAGLPVWPMTAAFAKERYEDLIVNGLDHHPNAYANRIAAEATAKRTFEELRSQSSCPGSAAGRRELGDHRLFPLPERLQL